MDAQTALFWSVLTIAIVALTISLLWSWRYDHEHDWAEKLARCLFVTMQCTIWGNLISFIVLDTVFHYAFGGAK